MSGICLFGGYDPDYPRSAVILSGLARLGVRVTECTASVRRKFLRRYFELGRRYLRTDRAFDVVYVPEFRHKDMVLAASLARASGKVVVFDPLVSRFDTRIRDRRDADERGPHAWHNRNLDRLSMGLADVVLADTAAHADYFSREFVPPDVPVRVLPVGYDDQRFAPRETAFRDGAVDVLFYGSYLPLHGADVIIDAAALLRDDERIHFELIGGGQTFEAVQRRVDDERLERVSLRARVALAELPARIARARVCLGIFGRTEKAMRVVPNKIYQCMGMDRAVVSAETPALREHFRDDRDVVMVPPGDATALARAIRALADDPARAARIGASAGEHVRREFGPLPIASRFLAICEEALER